MKLFRLFLFFILIQCMLQASEGGSIRIDVIGSAESVCSAEKEIFVSRRVRRDHGNVVYDLMLRQKADTAQWVPVRFSFTPEKSEKIRLEIRGVSHPDGDHPWLWLRDVSVAGANLLNGDFREIGSNRLPRFWYSRAENLVTGERSPAGGAVMRVSYPKMIAHSFDVTAGKKVEVSLFVRAEKPCQPFKTPDGVNVYTDGATGTRVVVSSGRIECRPTFENCGVYINRTPAERGKKLALKLFFRAKGEKTWIPALDPVNMERENAWRGSIFGLKENTPYEIRAEISGESGDTIRASFTTLDSAVPVAKTIVLDPKTFPGQLREIESGTPSGYVRYTMAPGGELVGERALDGGVIEARNARYVIFDGLKIKGNMARSGIKLSKCENIIIRNCEIYDFGRTDHIRDHRQEGRWTFNGLITGWDGGIFVEEGKNQLIERCWIHDPASTSNSWFYSHPTGPEAIFVDRARGGLVLRYNDLIGSDKKRWNDAVEGSGNGSIDGGFGRDGDVYGNLFAFSNDDSIEIEGGEMNIRVYGNRVEGSYCGVSTGCCRLGPSYQFRNLYFRLGDENGRCGLPFKNGMGNQGDGAVFIFNNTVVSPNLVEVSGGFHGKKPEYNPPLKLFSRNNIMEAQRSIHHTDQAVWNCDVDRNMLHISDPERAQTYRKFLADHRMEANALWAVPGYIDADGGNFRLAGNSPGRGAAEKLPNVESGNMGAFQEDRFLSLPFRPIPVESSRQALFFRDGGKPGETTFEITVGGKGFRSAYTIHNNDDFFTVTPSSGVLKSGDRITFTVKTDPGKMPMPKWYRGMALLRLENGFSRGISIYADCRDDEARHREAVKKAVVIDAKGLESNRGFEAEIELPEDGCYFLFGEGEFGSPGSFGRCSVEIGGVKTTSAARLIGRSEPTLKRHFAVVRHGHLSGWYFFLKKGKHRFTFQSDLKGMKVDTFYLTRFPEWFLR